MAVHHIANKEDLDHITEQSRTQATIIYVSNDAMPVSRRFTAQYNDLAMERSGGDLKFCRMEYDNATSSLLKFAPNQLPVIVLTCKGTWCQTIMSADMSALRSGIDKLRAVANDI